MMKKITLLCILLAMSFGYSQPTTNAPIPTNNSVDVISIYSDAYTNVATDYNPGWGQSGVVNTTYDPTGNGTNFAMAYTNFNYQGTLLNTQNASGMEYLHVDIWTETATDVKVTPINNGTGAGETLVPVTIVSGAWSSVDLPIADFTGMTWDSVFQFKFDGQAGVSPSDIYLDNIYFWKTPVAIGTDATLSDLQVDAVTVSGFNSSALDYIVDDLAQGTVVVPAVTVTTTDVNATYIITPAVAIPGTTTIDVTAADGTTLKTYTVAFSTLPGTPTTDAPTPTHLAANVISIYSDAYTDVATDYNPGWGQSGAVNTTYDPTGNGTNFAMAYTNFNYQGTLLNTQDASSMEYLHVDIWTETATDVKVTPINNGTGAGEVLVPVTIVSGAWSSVDLPIGDFTGMTWDSVFQFKFDGQAGVSPSDIYLDNIYFWKMPVVVGADATLSDLQVDAATIGGFNSTTLDYVVDDLANGTVAVPSVTVTTTDVNATYIITPAVAIPGTTTIDVTAADGTTLKTYTVAFSTLPGTPTTDAPTPTHSASNVISIYSDAYTNVATDYNPGWGQSGAVNTTYDPTGNGTNFAMAYTNFNYQGTLINTQDASSMEYLHVDIWTETATDVKVTPVNNGTGAGEVLAPVTIVNGAWSSVDLPIADFTGMTWDSIFQLKFDGQAGVSPSDIYLDNIYFWKVESLGTDDFELASFKAYPNPTQNSWTVRTENESISSINVFDVLGKKVLSLSPNTKEAIIDGSNLKRGLYFAQIKTAFGISSLKLIKK